MAFSTGLLRHRITVLQRTQAEATPFGIDGAGVSWTPAATLWAAVSFTRGVRAMAAGSLDAYAAVLCRLRFSTLLTPRDRIVFQGTVYQILPETFHTDRGEDVCQFQAQALLDVQPPAQADTQDTTE